MEEGSKVKARRRQAGMMAWLRGPNGGSKRVTRRQESRRSRARRPCACAVHMTFVFRPAPKATRQGVQSAVLQMRARYALYVCPCIHASRYIFKTRYVLYGHVYGVWCMPPIRHVLCGMFYVDRTARCLPASGRCGHQGQMSANMRRMASCHQRSRVLQLASLMAVWSS